MFAAAVAVCLLFAGCAVVPPPAANLKPVAKPQFQAGGEHFTGIGLQLGTKDGLLTVISALKDSPAFQSGLQPGDIIVEINGEVTRGMTLPEAVNRIRGAAGTTVKLKALRPAIQETTEYSITRVDIAYGSAQFNGAASSPVPTTLSPPSDSATPF